MRGVSANVAIVFAISLIPLMIGVSVAVDLIMLSDQEAKLQTAADAAAVAAAREFQLPKVSSEQLDAIVAAVVASEHGGATGTAGKTIAISTSYDFKQQIAKVTLKQPAASGIYRAITPAAMRVESTGRSYNGGTICVIGLDHDAIGTVSLTNFARLTATNCAVYSNSRNPAGIMSLIDALLHTQLTCSGGGTLGVLTNFDPRPQTDCPQLEDPLKDRLAPSSSGCTAVNTNIANGSQVLDPGVYCGGLIVSHDAHVTLNPGIYVIKNGPLNVMGTAQFSGEHVGFYLTGSGSVLTFNRNTEISLTAPQDGPMAGLLVFEDRSERKGRLHRILSDNARVLLGTLYLPRGTLLVDAFKPIADYSAYTAIVVDKLILKEGPNLVLNANYDSTDIPVPDGIGPVSGRVVLVK